MRLNYSRTNPSRLDFLNFAVFTCADACGHQFYIWGEPERAPHLREVRHRCLYVYIYIYIYVPYVVLGHGANLCRVQNRQNGRPLRSHCVRLKYSLRTALNEKEIVRNEAYTPTFPPGKDTGVGRRNIANSSSSTLENSQDPKRSTLQIIPIIQCPQATKNTQQHNRF